MYLLKFDLFLGFFGWWAGIGRDVRRICDWALLGGVLGMGLGELRVLELTGLAGKRLAGERLDIFGFLFLWGIL